MAAMAAVGTPEPAGVVVEVLLVDGVVVHTRFPALTAARSLDLVWIPYTPSTVNPAAA